MNDIASNTGRNDTWSLHPTGLPSVESQIVCVGCLNCSLNLKPFIEFHKLLEHTYTRSSNYFISSTGGLFELIKDFPYFMSKLAFSRSNCFTSSAGWLLELIKNFPFFMSKLVASVLASACQISSPSLPAPENFIFLRNHTSNFNNLFSDQLWAAR